MKPRSGLTLLELVVVLVILAALAALVIPRLSGVADQTNSAVNMSVVADLNRAVATYETRFDKAPGTWDGLVPQSGTALYSKLHPDLASKLTGLTLDAVQAKSLTDAGVTGMMVVDPAYDGAPSDAAISSFAPVATGAKVPTIIKETWAGHGSTFLDRAFNVLPSFGRRTSRRNPNEYVVLGVGLSNSMRGSTLTRSADHSVGRPDPLLRPRALCLQNSPDRKHRGI
jgi:prepilin-type N-terminal cleavage/methylation domain-containing protein